MRWETVVCKFERLSDPQAGRLNRRALVDAVADLDSIRIAELAALLEGELRDERRPAFRVSEKE
jgi:2-methylcitrate dehydratase